MTNTPLHLAPSTWMRDTGIRLESIDGWDNTAVLATTDYVSADFGEPITRAEFLGRAELCEISRWPHPPYDERPEPPNEFVSLLADALKSEFGSQFGMGINADDESWKRAARGMARKMRCELYEDNDMHRIVRFRNVEGE